MRPTMCRTTILAALAVALGAGAGTARAQGGSGRVGFGKDASRGDGRMRPDSATLAAIREERLAAQHPIGMLLEARGELALTSAQVSRMQALMAQLDEFNRPLAMRLDSLRRSGGELGGTVPREMTPAQRDSVMTRRRALADIMAEVHDNNRMARLEAMKLLTPEQQRRADEVEERVRRELQEITANAAAAGRSSGGTGRPPRSGPP